MNIKELKELIDATIYPNGEKKIKASSHQSMLHEIVDYTDENITTINDDLEEVKSTLETQGNDIDGLKESNKQTELNEAKVNQKIDNLASNIVGLGGDIKGSVKGADVIELPNVAINGVAPKTKIEGLTLVNVVKNGNFENGLSSWSSNLSNSSVSSGVLTNKPNTISAGYSYGIYTRGSVVNVGDLVYCNLYVNPTSDTNFRFGVEPSSTRVTSNSWQLVSNVTEAKTYNPPIVFYYTSLGWSESDVFRYRDITVINLTQMFGKGNEPTKEWCDKHIKGYIDGVQSVQTPLRVKSIGENKINRDDIISDKYRFIEGSVTYQRLPSSTSKFADVNIIKASYFSYIGKGGGNNSRLRVKYTDGTYSGADTHLSKDSVARVGFNLDSSKIIEGIYITFSTSSSDWSYIDIDSMYIGVGDKYVGYDSSMYYINSSTTLKSTLKAKDYVENGTLFKNVFATKEFKKDDVRRQYTNESLVNTYAFYFDIEDNTWLKDGFSDNTNRIALFSDGETYSCVGSTIATDIEDIIFLIEDGRNYIMLKINKSKIDGLAGATPLDKFKAYMGNRSLIINYQANTEQIKLDISGIVTTKPNGTIFVENIKNVTDFYTANGLDVKDFKELVSIYKYEGSDLVQLDASKAVFTTTLKHPDFIDGDLVFFEYKYLDSPLWDDNEIEYFNKNNVLQSENGKLWQKVEKASNEGVLTTELKEIV